MVPTFSARHEPNKTTRNKNRTTQQGTGTNTEKKDAHLHVDCCDHNVGEVKPRRGGRWGTRQSTQLMFEELIMYRITVDGTTTTTTTTMSTRPSEVCLGC